MRGLEIGALGKFPTLSFMAAVARSYIVRSIWLLQFHAFFHSASLDTWSLHGTCNCGGMIDVDFSIIRPLSYFAFMGVLRFSLQNLVLDSLESSDFAMKPGAHSEVPPRK